MNKKFIFALLLLAFSCVSLFAQNSPNPERVKIEEDQSYLVLSTKKISTMEKELDEVSAKGFRVIFGAPTQQYDMALFLRRLAKDEEPYNYKILATVRNKTMQKELNDLAVQGYRLLPRTMIIKHGFLTAELVMVMERSPKSDRAYEYKLIDAGKETKLHKMIDAAVAEGFQPVTMITMGEHTIVLEKEIPRKL